jgi:hypothetical protein
MINELVKIVVFVPVSHADKVRQAMGNAGAGKIGNYSHCSFSVKGVGRYKPMEGANLMIGEVGKYESVEEERIETVCPKNILEKVISVIKKVHPCEEVQVDIYPLLNF